MRIRRLPSAGKGAPPAGGFSMLEMMIAAGILGIVLAVVLRAHFVHLGMLEDSANKTSALMLAEKLIAEIEAAPEVEPGDFEGDFEEEEFSGFIWRTAISPLSFEDTVFEDVFSVEVFVYWEDGSRKVSLSTLLLRQR